jgi:hypothetical protein
MLFKSEKLFLQKNLLRYRNFDRFIIAANPEVNPFKYGSF